MTKLNWDKAGRRTPDPARAQVDEDVLAPDPIVVQITDLTLGEKRRIADIEAKRDKARAELKAAEKRRRRKRRAARKAIFREDAERETRLRAESEKRKAARERGETL